MLLLQPKKTIFTSRLANLILQCLLFHHFMNCSQKYFTYLQSQNTCMMLPLACLQILHTSESSIFHLNSQYEFTKTSCRNLYWKTFVLVLLGYVFALMYTGFQSVFCTSSCASRYLQTLGGTIQWSNFLLLTSHRWV